MDFKLKHTLTGHRGGIFKLMYDPYRECLLSAGGDGWIAGWDLDKPADGRLIGKDDDNILTILPCSNGIIFGGTLQGNILWIDKDWNTARKITHHAKGVFDLVHYNEELISTGADGRITFWDIEKLIPKESLHLSHKNLRRVALHPHQPLMAVGAGDGCIYILDPNGKKLLSIIKNAHERTVFSLLFSPNGDMLISGGMDAKLKSWSTTTWNNTADIPAHLYTVNDMALHPIQPIMATASRDKSIKIWNVHTLELLKVLDRSKYDAHFNSVNSLLWSRDGQFLYSGGDDRIIRIWEMIY